MNYVIIKGLSVPRPGKYELLEGMLVSDLINSSEGLLNNSYLELAHIVRYDNDLQTNLIDINLNKVLDNDPSHNLKLQYLDELIIYDKNYLKNVFTNVKFSEN